MGIVSIISPKFIGRGGYKQKDSRRQFETWNLELFET